MIPKRTITAAACLLVLCICSVGSAKEISVGAKVGFALNYARFTSDYPPSVENADRGQGSAVVIQIERMFSTVLAMRVEAGWLQKAYAKDLKEYAGVESDQVDSRINYFSFALLLKATTPFDTYFIAGPRIDLKSTLVEKQSDYFLPEKADYLNGRVLGLTAGIGQELPVEGRGALFLEAQFQYDLTPAFDASSNRSVTSGSFSKTYNSVVVLLFGFRM